MVSAAAIQPEVAQAFDDLTTATYHYSVDQFPILPPNPLVGLNYEEAARTLRESTGATLMGVARPQTLYDEGKPPFEVLLSPPADTRIEKGWYVLVLSGAGQGEKLRAWIRVPAGRPRKFDGVSPPPASAPVESADAVR